MDVKLTSSWDVELTGNAPTLISGAAAVEQHWLSRMRTFRGEWFLDQRVGLPYYQDVLVKNPNLPSLVYLFKRATRETPGVASVTYCNLSLDAKERKLTVVVEGKYDPAVADGTYSYSFEEFILPQAGSPET